MIGTPRLASPQGQEWHLERKTLALLAYLALEGCTPRSRLSELLWPQTPRAAARNNLVHLLRRLKGLCGVDLVHGTDALVLTSTLWVDAVFVLKAPGDGEVPLGAFLAGMDFDDLPDFADWVAAWREDLDVRRLANLAHAAARHESLGAWAEALRVAGQIQALDPFSEEALQRVMRLHYLAGDRPAALRAYARGQEFLMRELGVELGEQTRALAHRIDHGEELPGAVPTRALALPLGVLRPPTLVGREAAWARLEEAWEAGKTIYVTGDAGVGKTRLVQDFVASKGRAMYLPGHPGSADVPFAAAAHNVRARMAAAPHVQLPQWVRRELSRVLPELRGQEPVTPIDSEAARLHYFLAHLEVVRLTAPGFAAVITDDVQHYDAATVELGAFFLTQGPVLGEDGEVPRHIITYRRGTLPPLTAARIAALVASGTAAMIELEPLDGGGVAALLGTLEIEGAAELSQELHHLTGGNPQFVLEVLRHMYHSGEFRVNDALRGRPAGAVSLIAQRLGHLTSEALQAARAAAVLGDSLTLERLSEVLGIGLLDIAGAWEELEAAQVVSGEGFSHDLVREALLDGLPAPVLALLHRASARVLARHTVHPGRVARHWQEAGDFRQAVPWMMQAGEVAIQTLRHAEAAGFYASAAELYTALDDPEGEKVARDAYAAALRNSGAS
ncbi:AAA family ATPase [Deinococcus humi]|uniref:DNA-binding SARP family transcriptional activator n=1 Tax=Deinococcus humi TaxID=662880 RepID=A0A7W8K0D7_9DEIO|nr:DNA-binding SARP family transcriptional activator [Deinococcus humi]